MLEEANKKLAHLRQEYLKKELDENSVDKNPVKQFGKWFEEALNGGIIEPNAMILATADTSGRPSTRVMLLKSFSNGGFTFYTNYHSRKGRDILKNPHGALCFLWLELERQVRIEGKIEKVSRQESEEYFAVRPRGSQLGAWVSQQSEEIPNRHFLEEKLKEVHHKFEGAPVPMPHSWGGYRLIPDTIEFWQGRASRLHDRILYTLSDANTWDISRLSP